MIERATKQKGMTCFRFDRDNRIFDELQVEFVGAAKQMIMVCCPQRTPRAIYSFMSFCNRCTC